MDLATVITEKGKINFTRITIETLIRIVLQEIKGIIQPKKISFPKIIQSFANENLETKKNITPEVRVEIKPDSIQVNLFLTIHYGLRIPDLTWEVQAKIKEKIKEVTSLDIEQINVHIQSIRFSKKYHYKRKLVAPGSFLKIF
ncbi:MAG TPA: Asp23/Gls24 family envelope stress response protein [Atribacterota bacterium]|nr:Asp23/Gls24 family envelope stress response protein [Atribacterota bacterium]